MIRLLSLFCLVALCIITLYGMINEDTDSMMDKVNRHVRNRRSVGDDSPEEERRNLMKQLTRKSNGLREKRVHGMNKRKKPKSKDSNRKKQPNIIFILADDLGFNDLGYMNSSILTPNIDSLSSTGARLENNYVIPICTPSRVALLTGIYPYKQGFQHMVLAEDNPHCVNQSIRLLPERLQDLGYNTHMIGKWHMGFCKWQCTPTYRGFDTFYGFYSGMGDYYNHTVNGGFDWRDQENVDNSTIGKYSSDLMRDRALQVIDDIGKNSKDEPFFLYLAFPNPHVPFQVDQKYLDMYPNEQADQRKTYMAMVTAMDEVIGDVVVALNKAGLYDDTLIAFSSDNGGEIGPASNSPLRGGKGALWEGGTRAQAFVHGHGVKQTGKVRQGLFHITDWSPTLLNIAGGSADDTFDGIDQTNFVLKNKKSKRNEFVINIDNEAAPVLGGSAIRVGDWKLISGNEGFVDGYYPNIQYFWDYYSYMLPTKRRRKRAYVFTPEVIYKMMTITNMKTNSVHLYNIAEDPEEMNDLAATNTTKLAEMQVHLANYVSEYVAPPSTAHDNVPEANPEFFGGNWSPGWC